MISHQPRWKEAEARGGVSGDSWRKQCDKMLRRGLFVAHLVCDAYTHM